jgi:hypothetical protein
MTAAGSGGDGVGRAPGVDQPQLALTHASGSSQVVPRHPKAIAYRCFLPDLTGFTDLRCAGPDSQRRTRWWWANGAALDREFSSAVADCGYRAPLVPRLARPAANGRRGRFIGQLGGGEGGIRTHDGLPRTAFPVPRPRPLGDLSWWLRGARARGGEGGIRTHGAVTRTPLFESGTFNHSDTSPRRPGV